MIKPNRDDSAKDGPLATPRRSRGQKKLSPAEGRLRRTSQPVSAAAGDRWAQTKKKASLARQRTDLFLRENPVPMILGALAAGLAIGLAIRYASRSEPKEIEVKSSFGRINWSVLSLPFVWPLFKSLKEKYEHSAETVKEGIDRVRNIDLHGYAKPIKKRWKAWTH